MSINIECSKIWDLAKNEKVHIHHDWSGITGVIAKNAVDATGIETDDKGIVINLNKDIKKICPNSKYILKDVSKLFGDFEDITCMGVNKFIDNQKIPLITESLVKEIKDKIKDLCPKVIKSCKDTICDGKKESFTLECKDINKLLEDILNDSKIQAILQLLIEQNLNIQIDISKINLCDLIQLLYSLGIDVSGLGLTLLNDELKSYGIKLSNDFINCICPDINETKPIDCEEVKKIVNMIIENKDIHDKIKSELGIDITEKNKCSLLQQLIDSGINPSSMLYNLIKDSKYSIEKNKIEEVINCICPDLKEQKTPPTPEPTPEPTPVPTPTPTSKIFYKKINIIIMSFLLILIFMLMFVFFKKMKIDMPFVVLLIIFCYIGILLVELNFKCLFKLCDKSGDDWKYLPGKFEGEKSIFGININAKIEIKNNIINLEELNCSGKNCPFKNLLDKCNDTKITINNKSNFGYSLDGQCINEIYKIKNKKTQIIDGLWLSLKDNNLTLNVKVNAPVVGTIFLNIPMKKV